MIRNLIRGIITLLLGAVGFYLNYILISLDFLNTLGWNGSLVWTYAIMSILFGIIGFLVAPVSIRSFIALMRWMDSRLTRVPTNDLMGGAVGGIIGLIIASLFGNSFVSIKFFGPLLAVLLSLFLGYLGLTIGMKRKEDVLGFLNFFPKFRDRGEKAEKSGDKADKGDKNKEGKAGLSRELVSYKILDTSVIIDGRIADIVKTGFLEGVLLIPSFVLEELRHIADSSDLLKRNRGRRGLDILNQISKETVIKVHIHEQDFDDINEVDSKLVRLGQVLNSPLLTNDYNLNKVAELQGVKVLNINELANALKPIVLPGEEMLVQVMKEGKEPGQGVAYLDDGTMIVVDMGRRYMGQNVVVLVTSVLQTAAGRMIFAKPKNSLEKKPMGLRPTDEVNAIG
ncbi:PIN/TRAM domain-containing protein [Desulfosporosinus meridiei]|uniref:Integral membrane protein (PIN domain superfamily) n=1 Tax=Desulfosporosinus meridiei (strain ATCC BAA-275 / DSM 13257 / KCTC 12902 / NCIMB 13706 / S10) TaxID=768704 RepID=J7IT58_DESMD|nr:PIN/TRAM domain-containing protein [Desulfosporosinus meridiei]AFQ42283.1 integral membrane protein (PIN domain superfamily) [Desulfosporosinus meridiei DSM 13257]